MNAVPSRPAGFSLVEVAIALGVAAFCLVSVFGLLPVGLNSNQSAIRQTAAAGIASAMVSDLRSPTKVGASPFYGVTIPATGSATATIYLREDGTATGAPNTSASAALNPAYRATLVFTVPPATTSYFGAASSGPTQGTATVVRLLITWPALADLDYSKAPKNFAGSFETMTALDRN